MFIKLSISGAMSAANANILNYHLFVNCKTLNSIADIMALDIPVAIKSVIDVPASEFVKGAALNCTLTPNDTIAVDITQPLLSHGRSKVTRYTTATGTLTAFNGTASSVGSIGAGAALAVGNSHIFSISDRHIFLASHSIVCAAMFEFVANDGFYTPTSAFLPYGVTVQQWASSFASSFRPIYSAGSMNCLTGASILPSSSQMGWETPFGNASLFNPDTNNGYDFVGSNSERTPILVPFGVQYKALGIVGGSISELCDFYLGPNNLAGAFESVEVGDTDYMCYPISAGAHMLYIPKR